MIDETTGTEQEPESTADQTTGDTAASAQADTTGTTANPEQTAADDAGAEKPEGEGEQPKPKRTGGFQKRISELTREREEKAREAEYWRQAALNGVKPDAQAKPQPDPNAEPKPENYQSYEDYIDARTEYRIEQKMRREATERQARDADSRQRELQERFRAGMDKARETYADFDDALENIGGMQAHPMVANAILMADRGHDILYWLGMNPDEAARIAKLDPLVQVKELGRIEANLPTAPARKVTQTKPPPTVLKGGGTARKDPASMSMDEYVAWRTANPNA